MSQIHAELLKEAARIERLVLRALSRLGEECVKKARDRAQEESWFDQTGNLRSSIGYVIVQNGRIVVESDFQQVKQGSEGVKTGREFAEEIAKQFTSGYVLVVVAGMNYAEYVEARDNKDVLTTPELYAQNRLPAMMEKLRKQIWK